MRAPWASKSASAIALPSPAPAWIRTSWPRSASSRTPIGVIATRYSSGLISVGTPTFTRVATSSTSISNRQPRRSSSANTSRRSRQRSGGKRPASLDPPSGEQPHRGGHRRRGRDHAAADAPFLDRLGERADAGAATVRRWPRSGGPRRFAPRAGAPRGRPGRPPPRKRRRAPAPARGPAGRARAGSSPRSQPKLSPKVRSSECRVWIVSASPIGSPKSTVPPGLSGSSSAGRAVAEDDRRHGQLVEDRPQRVGDAEAPWRRQVAARRGDVDRTRPSAARARRRPSRRHQVRLPRRRADPEHGEQAGLLELVRACELALGHPVEATEVEVVDAGREAGIHRLEVDPVAGRVDEHVAALERPWRASPRRPPARWRRRAPRAPCRNRARRRRGRRGPRRGRAARARAPRRTRRDRGRSPARSSPRRRGRRRRRRVAHPFTCTSSLRSQRQPSSIRSVARPRSRPVSSSILRIR